MLGVSGDAGPKGIQDRARGAAVVGVAVGVGVGDGVFVGDFVGDVVGDAVGVLVGDAVGVFVGDEVGVLVGDGEGEVDGEAVGEGVGGVDGGWLVDGVRSVGEDDADSGTSEDEPSDGLPLSVGEVVVDASLEGDVSCVGASVARVTGTSGSLGSPQHASSAASVDASTSVATRVCPVPRRCHRTVTVGLPISPDMAPPLP